MPNCTATKPTFSNSNASVSLSHVDGKKLMFEGNSDIDIIRAHWCSWEGGLDLTIPYEYNSKRWGISSYCGIQGFQFNPTKKKGDTITKEVYLTGLDKVFNSVDADIKSIKDTALRLAGYTACLWGGGATKHIKNKYGSLKNFAQLANNNSEEQNILLLEELKILIISEYNKGNIVNRNHWGDNDKGHSIFESSKKGVKRRWESIHHDYCELNL